MDTRLKIELFLRVVQHLVLVHRNRCFSLLIDQFVGHDIIADIVFLV